MGDLRQVLLPVGMQSTARTISPEEAKSEGVVSLRSLQLSSPAFPRLKSLCLRNTQQEASTGWLRVICGSCAPSESTRLFCHGYSEEVHVVSWLSLLRLRA